MGFRSIENFIMNFPIAAESRAGTRLSGSLLCAAYALALGILLYPLTLIDMPPLLDYPIHIARVHILLNHDSDPILASIFATNWRPIPNLAIDIVALALGQFMSAEMAGRVFLGLCLTTTMAGVIVLHRVNFNRWSWWPLLTALPAYHGALMAGFVNFSFGLALTPLAIAFWIRFRGHGLCRLILLHGTMTILLYMSHILALGLYGLILGAYELSRWTRQPRKKERWRRTLKLSVTLTSPFLFAMMAYFWLSLSHVIERGERVLYGEWRPLPKLRGALMPVLTYDHALDAAAILILITIPLFFVWTGRLTIKADFLLPIFLLLSLFILLPGQIADSSFIMERLSIAAVLIAIGAMQPQHLSWHWGAATVMVVFIVAIGRTNVIANNWLESADYYQRATIMSENVEPGASVLFVSPFSSPEIHNMNLWRHRFSDQPDWHYALINIPAVHSLPVLPLTKRSAFTQLHFVWPDKQILELTRPYWPYTYGDGNNATFSPRRIFDIDERGRPCLTHFAEIFRYILILYPQYIASEDRAVIAELDPIYADQDMLLIDRMRGPGRC